MAYRRAPARRAPARGGYARKYSSTRRASARSTRRAPARRSGSRSTGFSRGSELRIVIEQPGASGVSRYPGIAAKLNPGPRKAKF